MYYRWQSYWDHFHRRFILCQFAKSVYVLQMTKLLGPFPSKIYLMSVCKVCVCITDDKVTGTISIEDLSYVSLQSLCMYYRWQSYWDHFHRRFILCQFAKSVYVLQMTKLLGPFPSKIYLMSVCKVCVCITDDKVTGTISIEDLSYVSFQSLCMYYRWQSYWDHFHRRFILCQFSKSVYVLQMTKLLGPFPSKIYLMSVCKVCVCITDDKVTGTISIEDLSYVSLQSLCMYYRWQSYWDHCHRRFILCQFAKSVYVLQMTKLLGPFPSKIYLMSVCKVCVCITDDKVTGTIAIEDLSYVSLQSLCMYYRWQSYWDHFHRRFILCQFSKSVYVLQMTKLLGPFPSKLYQRGKFFTSLKMYTDDVPQKNGKVVLTAAAQIAYPNKFTTFPTKLIKYLHNLIEIYMYIGYRLGQRQRQTPVGYWNCGHAERHSAFNTTSKWI